MPSVTEMLSLRGRTCLVTGGSRGIGEGIVKMLLGAGATVILVARNEARAAQTAARLAGGERCVPLAADIATEEGISAILATVSTVASDRLDILVNNAGRAWGGSLEGIPRAAWDRVLATNVTGMFTLTTALLPALRRAASPSCPARIVNIGSVDGTVPSVFDNYPYSASKAAVHHLTRQLASRVAGDSITVNAVAPGAIRTDMTSFITDDPEQLTAVEGRIPLGHMGQADDVAAAVLFLVAATGAYITGIVLPVDGGLAGAKL